MKRQYDSKHRQKAHSFRQSLLMMYAFTDLALCFGLAGASLGIEYQVVNASLLAWMWFNILGYAFSAVTYICKILDDINYQEKVKLNMQAYSSPFVEKMLTVRLLIKVVLIVWAIVNLANAEANNSMLILDPKAYNITLFALVLRLLSPFYPIYCTENCEGAFKIIGYGYGQRYKQLTKCHSCGMNYTLKETRELMQIKCP